MDIKIPDSWLRVYLDTNATPKQIQEALSLCGPSIERLTKIENDYVYHTEVTTNRVDMMSIIGIAFEAIAVLPRFGYKAKLKMDPYTETLKLKTKNKVNYLKVNIDKNLCKRFSAVLIKDVKVEKSPDWLSSKLNAVGLRSINNVVDISNYLMIEMGQPVHTFDWDKIGNSTMILRESKKGEKLTTLDNKEHELPGGDIVIEDGSGSLIDLCGIMGGANSAVDENTKNVLLFVQVYESSRIRKTSMSLAHRTDAANLFEKGLPVENVLPTLKKGIDLLEKTTGGKAEKTILDILNIRQKPTFVKFNEPIEKFVSKILGVKIEYSEIVKILKSLEIIVKSKVLVEIPWVRQLDLVLPEDIAEEVARIYGYHNLQSEIMSGKLPENNPSTSFKFENKIKQTLKGFGGVEVYTLSLVSKEEAGDSALKLKNPLGSDSEYLRTSLRPSLVNATKPNSFEKNPFHLFEIANVYIQKKNDLPSEVMTLAGIFENTDFREAKGVVEALFSELNIKTKFETMDSKFYVPSKRLIFKVGSEKIGEFGILETGQIYYEFQIEKLKMHTTEISKFEELPKYPPQIEDITFELPEKTKIGDVVQSIKQIELISEAELTDIYKNSHTFRVYYQNPTKTLNDTEVEELREKLLKTIKSKFGGTQKN